MFAGKYLGSNLSIGFAKKDKVIGNGYIIVIRQNGSPFTAFRTQLAFETWLGWTGLKYQDGRFLGQFEVTMEWLNTKDFFRKYNHFPTYPALNNGSYTPGFIEETEEGNVLHVQNPNMDCIILDGQKTSSLIDGGHDHFHTINNRHFYE